MNEETGGTVVYTDIKWERIMNPAKFTAEYRGVMHYGYGIDLATLDQGRAVMFVCGDDRLAVVEAQKNDAETQMAHAIADYVEKTGASMTKYVKARQGDSFMVGNPCVEIQMTGAFV